MISGLKDKWETLTPKNKQLTFLGAIVGVVVIAVFAGSGKPPPKAAKAPKNVIELIEKNSGSMDLEQLVGQNQLLSNKLSALQDKYVTMDENFKSVKRSLTLNSEIAETPQMLYNIQRQIENLKKEQMRLKNNETSGYREQESSETDIIEGIIAEAETDDSTESIDAENGSDSVFDDDSQITTYKKKPNVIPSNPLAYVNAAYENATVEDETDNQYLTGTDQANNQAQTSPGAKIKIVTPEKAIDETESLDKTPKWIGAVLPAGTLIPAIVISGVDAPTGKAAEKGAVISTMRVTGPAILPNGERIDLTGCFVVNDVRGDLATQRATFRTISLSCHLGEIGIVDTPIQGYVSGKDGTLGFRGRVINKQGEALLYSAGAGIIGGFGNAFSGGSGTNTITTGGQFELPSAEEAMTAGVGQGISDASDTLSEYYKEQLDLLYPVIEIKPMIFGSIHIIKTIQLRLFKADK